MEIIHILVYYLGIQLLLSGVIYFYYLGYFTAKCNNSNVEIENPYQQQNKTYFKILKIFFICALIAVLYHSYLDVKYRH